MITVLLDQTITARRMIDWREPVRTEEVYCLHRCAGTLRSKRSDDILCSMARQRS